MDGLKVNEAKQLLQKMTELLPVDKARHNITLRDDKELELTVFHGGMWHSFQLPKDITNVDYLAYNVFTQVEQWQHYQNE